MTTIDEEVILYLIDHCKQLLNISFSILNSGLASAHFKQFLCGLVQEMEMSQRGD